MTRAFFAVLAVPLCAAPLSAQIAVSANDAKATLVDGVVTVAKNPKPDSITILDLGVSPPRVIAELPAPTSVVGPPESVAVSPDNAIALVTASTKVDPADPARTVPDDRVTVIALEASPPAVVATLHAGSGASGVSFNPAGTLALVANRMEGTVSIFSVDGRTVAAAGKVDLGAPESGPSGIAFTRDGRTALVTRNNDSLISLLRVEGATVTYEKRDIAAALKPYSIVTSPTADVAVVGHVGAGPTGGADVLSLIDLGVNPPRAVYHVTTGPTAEGVAVSNDGRYVAVTVMNGSNAPKNSPLHNPGGILRIFTLGNRTLAPLAEAPVGQWCQGAAWNREGNMLLVQCMAERELLVFRFDGKRLSRTGSIKVAGGPAGIRTGR